MKTRALILLPVTVLALCSVLSAPRGLAAEKEKLNAADVGFIKEAAADGMAELKLAELGLRKAGQPDVKTFAGTVVKDHAKAREELKTLAADKGVELPEVTDHSEDTDTFQKLQKSSQSDFDSQFLTEMSRRAKVRVSDFEEASKHAGDVDVRAYAGETLPTLRAHLKRATELSSPDTANSKRGEPDNTARNKGDGSGGKLTPLDQGSSQNDTEITAQIRRQIMAAKELSMDAKNVKIITLNGRVTLRGPVGSAEEKRLITEMASRLVRADLVDCQLEVK